MKHVSVWTLVAVVGDVDGDPDGDADGEVLGEVVGNAEGEVVGESVLGDPVGCELGASEGVFVGWGDGCGLGPGEGCAEGLAVGPHPQVDCASRTSAAERNPAATRHATHSVPSGSPHSHASHVASHVLLAPYSRSSHALMRVVESTW